jgi:hypothetical protein
MGVTSMTMPPVEEYPAKLWPPLRVAVARPWRRAKAITSAASSGTAQRTTAWGSRSSNQAVNGARACS